MEELVFILSVQTKDLHLVYDKKAFTTNTIQNPQF